MEHQCPPIDRRCAAWNVTSPRGRDHRVLYAARPIRRGVHRRTPSCLGSAVELRLCEIRRRLAQDLVRLAKLPVLPLQRREPFALGRSSAQAERPRRLERAEPTCAASRPNSRASTAPGRWPTIASRARPGGPGPTALPGAEAPTRICLNESSLQSLKVWSLRETRRGSHLQEQENRPAGQGRVKFCSRNASTVFPINLLIINRFSTLIDPSRLTSPNLSNSLIPKTGYRTKFGPGGQGR